MLFFDIIKWNVKFGRYDTEPTFSKWPINIVVKLCMDKRFIISTYKLYALLCI